jgi:tetratricopeptide (TPR) repeat protein
MYKQTPGQIAGSEGPVSPGRAVQIVRTQLYIDTHNRLGLTQSALYQLCTAVEDQLLVPGNKRRSFKPVRGDRNKKKIGKIENRTNKQDDFKLGIIARAFGLPEDFFRTPFESEEALKAAFAAKTRSLGEDRRPPAPQPPLSSANPRRPVGFPNISAVDPLPESRRRAAQDLADEVLSTANVRSRLVLLQGRTGVGKTFFVAHWFRDYGRRVFGSNALRIDCATISLDQVLPAIEQHFISSRDSSNMNVADALAANSENLIVLDGLRFEHFKEGPRLSGITPGRRPRLVELAQLISKFVNPTSNTTAIVCVENNSNPIADSLFVRTLADGVEVTTRWIEALSDEEGANFLAMLGATQEDDRRLRTISSRLHGLPMALVAAAFDLSRLPAEARETYLESVSAASVSDIDEDFARFFRNHLDRMVHPVSDGESADPHPLAFLRLLALMPGPVPRSHLAEILDGKRLKRLKNLSIESAMKAEVSFTTADDDQINLHAFVRNILRAELNGFIEADSYDPYTSRDELEWIHWRAAILNWRIILKGNEATTSLVPVIESFVYHMMAQTRLVTEQRRTRRFPAGLNENTINLFEQDAGKLTNAKLWLIAYHRVVRKFLLDKRFVATRIHGQYEAKARILQMLTDAATDGVPVPRHELAELYKETAVCWMHAGRLQSAMRAARLAANHLAEKKMVLAMHLARTPSADGRTAEAWRLRCEVESTFVTIESRQARLFSEAIEELRPMLEVALEIADRTRFNDPIDEPNRWAPAAERGALRILARAADVLFQGGQAEEAIDYFDRADRLQKAIRGRHLDGEAARKFCTALVRTRDLDSGRLRRAVDLIEVNIRRHEDDSAVSQARVSNDIIPFLVLRAALQRIAGDLAQALATIEGLRRHNYVTRGECTYVAIAELEMEEIRLHAVAFGPSSRLFEQAKALRTRLFNSHHHLMSFETALISVECCDAVSRAQILNECERFFIERQALVRVADIKELEGNRSAIRRFGL